MNVKRLLSQVLLLIGLLLIVAACNQTRAASIQTSQASSGAKPVVLVLTERDNNSIKHIHQGQMLEVRFSNGDAETPRSSMGLLVQVTTSQQQKGGVWDFVAARTGTTIISSSIAPVCKRGMPCPQFFSIWHVTIVITG